MKFLEAEVVTEEAVLAIEVLVAFLFLYYAGSPEVGPAGVIAEAGYTGSAEAGHTEVAFLYYTAEAGLGLIAVEAAAGLAEAAEISEVAEVAEVAAEVAEVAAEVAEVAAEVAAAEAEPAGLVEPLAEPEPEA
jgi:hypothetical protein